ncbi:hypothetical protein HDU92_000913 [Lobulomyces angularis]|nr:hypothetical protein HDU92_000913 [Lobulomyces angularis]
MGRKAKLLSKLQNPDNLPTKEQSSFRSVEREFKKTYVNENDKIPQINYEILQSYSEATMHPGIILLKNFLSIEQQKELTKLCMNDFNKLPNLTNLDKYYETHPEGLFPTYSQYYYSNRKSILKLKKPHEKLKDIEIQKAFRQIRWVNLGLSYDWSNKAYYDKNSTDLPEIPSHLIDPPVPEYIQKLVEQALKAVESQTDYLAKNYKSEAGIINFYGLKDTLMAHQDRSEQDSLSPLVSFSIGHSCILLVGTEDRKDTPIPIILESGDCFIMYGPARRCFHGVPRILENTLPLEFYPSIDRLETYIQSLDPVNDMFRIPKLKEDLELLRMKEGWNQTRKDWDIFGEYLLESRLNINIRQVNPAVQKKTEI